MGMPSRACSLLKVQEITSHAGVRVLLLGYKAPLAIIFSGPEEAAEGRTR